MERRNEYSGSLTREQFLFYEARSVAQLIETGKTRDEILSIIRNDNIFQFPTERMVTSIFNTCIKRIELLNSNALVQMLAEAPADEAKLVNLYAMMRYNRVVWDFMITVVGEKYRTQDYHLSQSDLNLFVMRLQEQNDQVAAWGESTVKKIKQVLRRCLVECGYLSSSKTDQLNLVFPSDTLIQAIKENRDNDALAAFNTFVVYQRRIECQIY